MILLVNNATQNDGDRNMSQVEAARQVETQARAALHRAQDAANVARRARWAAEANAVEQMLYNARWAAEARQTRETSTK